MFAKPCSARSRSAWTPAVCLGLGLLLVARPAEAAPADDLKLAVAHYNGKRYEEAAASFQLYLKAAPKDAKEIPTAQFFLGLSQVHLEQYDDARQTLRAFVRDHAKDEHVADARYQTGWSSYLLGDHESAVREFRSFLDNHEKHRNAEYALTYLGDALLQSQEPDAAAKSFRRSLDAFPKGAMAEDARMGLARAYELQKLATEAIEEYRVVANDPRATRRAEARFAAAGLLYGIDLFEESAEEYDAFVDAFPEGKLLPAARLNGGFAHFKAGNFETAIERFDAAAADPEQAGTARYWSGLALRELGEHARASAQLAAAFAAAKEGANAPTILYQWADTEFLRGEYASAAKLFAQLSDGWPKDDLGDDALHEAGNSALRNGDVNEAIRLVNLFEERYGDRGPLAIRQQVLTARIELARGKPEDVRRAEQRLEVVLRTAKDDDETIDHARYELARARYQLEDHDGVAKALEQLLPRVRKAGRASPYVEALVLASSSLLAAEEYAAADVAAADYLSLEPTGPQAHHATANRAVARARLGEREPAENFLEALAVLDRDAELLHRTQYDVGEIAYDAEDYAWAAAAYESVLEDGLDTKLAPAALYGLAWSKYQQKDFAAATPRFRSFVERFGDDPKLGPEARFMVGKSLQDAGEFAEAAKAFEAGFAKYAPSTPAAAGAEQEGSTGYAFKAGVQAAESSRRGGDVARADEAFQRVHATFPKAKGDDVLLDTWALMHYRAENFERADELFRELVERHPESDRADDARFHLAESANLAGRTEDARKAFTALAADASADEYVRELSLFHLLELDVAARDWPAVVERSQRFVERFPKSRHVPLATFRRAEALVGGDAKGTAAARTLLTGLLDDWSANEVAKEPWFARVRLLLAELAVREKDYDAAVAHVETLFEERPESPFLYQAHELRGRVHKQQAQFVEARAEFAKVTDDEHGAKTETAAKAQFMIAETHLMQKDYRNARREFVKVSTLYDFPEWRAHALFQAGGCDEALGNLDAARQAYQDLLADYPESDHAQDARDRLRVLGRTGT
jgi:cellulose synthase operon protein C